MVFEVRRFRHEDLDLIYTPERSEEVFEASEEKRNWWPQNMHHQNVAIDEARQVYLYKLSWALNGERSLWRYMFLMPSGMVQFEMVSYCLFDAKYVSPALRTAAEAAKAKALIVEAFATAGLYINGVTDPTDPDAVPNAEVTGF
jgi:hypothetical protein